MMRHSGRAFRREELLHEVWGYSTGDTSTVTVHVRRLREKIELDPAHPDAARHRVGRRLPVQRVRESARRRDAGMRRLAAGCCSSAGGLGTAVLAACARSGCPPATRAAGRRSRSACRSASVSSVVACSIGPALDAPGGAGDGRRSSSRSVGTLAGALVAARAMFVSTHDLRALVVVMIGAGTVAALAGAAPHPRDRSRPAASSAAVARQIGAGEQTSMLARGRAPEELARLGAELSDMRRRLDEARRRSQRVEQSRREVIAWVSHDLRTPLSRMRVMVEAINDGVIDDDPTIDRYHRAMQREVERLGGLVDDLFELSRIQADALSLRSNRWSSPIWSPTRSRRRRSQPSARASSCPATCSTAPRWRELSIPEMARVLHNLLDNAIRHSPPGGVVQVSVGRRRRRGRPHGQRRVRRHRGARSRARLRPGVPRRSGQDSGRSG